MKLFLIREKESDAGTFGRIIAGDFICHSLELPWKENQRNISCIPSGIYKTSIWFSRKYKRRIIRLSNVPDRSDVLIHQGNLAGDTEKGFKTHSMGCILPGMKTGLLYGQPGVLLSGVALNMIIAALPIEGNAEIEIVGG